MKEFIKFDAKRKVPDFDDLVFLGASMSRYPLEGYRETCNTSVILGDRFAKKPIKLDIPITIAGMSFGALGANALKFLVEEHLQWELLQLLVMVV